MRNHVTEREGPWRLAGQRSTNFGALQLTIDERYDYIADIWVKDDPLRAHKVRFELVEGTDSLDTARFC